MAFVYRYSYANKRFYYGMTSRGIYGLVARINDHARKKEVEPHWLIHFTAGLTGTDADILESHLINVDGKHLINKAKRTRGPVTIARLSPPVWIRYQAPPSPNCFPFVDVYCHPNGRTSRTLIWSRDEHIPDSNSSRHFIEPLPEPNPRSCYVSDEDQIYDLLLSMSLIEAQIQELEDRVDGEDRV